MRKLTELHPKWSGRLRPDSGEALEFDCPNCMPSHRVVAYLTNPRDGEKAAGFGDERWTLVRNEDWDQVTITPSIQYPCFHGWIEKGHYIDIAESPAVVGMLTPEGMKMVSLSPLQARDYARTIIERSKALLP